MTGVAWWSQTAASNANADPQVGWPEGMAPSAVNDSARAEMAGVAKWRDDISGAIVTGGTSTAFTVSSYQAFDNLSRLNNQVIAFTPHATNTGTSTLDCDGLGAKPLRSAPSVELFAGTLIQGTPYTCLYNHSDQVFYLRGFYGNPYNIPLGGLLDYAGSTAPNSAFVLPYGQAISRSTYASFFSLVSTTFGGGDGTTTFNVPDLRGRVVAAPDAMGGTPANRLTDGVTGIDTLGDAGGNQSKTLVTANLPPYTPSGTATFSGNSMTNVRDNISSSSTGGGQFGINVVSSQSDVTPTGSVSLSMNAQGGTSTAFSLVQPTLVLTKIMRVL